MVNRRVLKRPSEKKSNVGRKRKGENANYKPVTAADVDDDLDLVNTAHSPITDALELNRQEINAMRGEMRQAQTPSEKRQWNKELRFLVAERRRLEHSMAETRDYLMRYNGDAQRLGQALTDFGADLKDKSDRAALIEILRTFGIVGVGENK